VRTLSFTAVCDTHVTGSLALFSKLVTVFSVTRARHTVREKVTSSTTTIMTLWTYYGPSCQRQSTYRTKIL